jgi:class 3 adenylate cyclase
MSDPSVVETLPTDAERRQVAVMMVDLVGSSRLARRLDPEDLSSLTLAYRRAASGAIAANGGYVARYLGDGILAYWGYPSAREDDVRRAIAGGLAAQRAVLAADARHGIAGVRLEARIGIAVGIVVVGRIEGVGAEAGGDILGDAPNLADRIQKLAPPGAVLVSAAAQRLAAAAYEFAPAGAVVLASDAGELAPAPAPVPVFRVLAAKSGSRRGRGPLSGVLHGRAAESTMLADRWQAARQGRGGALLVQGDPGIGKSSLVAGLRPRVQAEAGFWLDAGCLPENAALPLKPASDLLRGWLGDAAEQPDAARARLLETLPNVEGALQHVDALARLVDPAAPDGAATRPSLFAALTAWLLALAADRPAVVLIEDLHWSDPSTQEWLGTLLPMLHAARLLLLTTSRQLPEGLMPVIPALALQPLPQQAVAAIVTGIEGGSLLPPASRQAIVARAEGNPLFAEELTLLAQHSADSNLLTLPSSLNDSLLARLDEVGAARAVARAAAVLGRDFDRALLAAVVDMPGDALDQALAALSAAGLVHRLHNGTATHAFRHALIRDASYRSLLREPRRALHARAAAALQAGFPETVAARPSLVALHLEEAGNTAAATEWWTRTGDHAARLGAPHEAADAYARALRLLGPNGKAAAENRAVLLVRLGPQRMAIDGNGAASVEAAFSGALEALDQAEVAEPALRFAALRGLQAHAMVRANMSRALAVGTQLLALARADGRDDQVLQAHRSQALAFLLHGDHDAAARHFEATLALYDADRHGDHRFRFGSDPAALVHAHRAWGLAITGCMTQSDRQAEQARMAARRWQHAHTTAHVLGVDALRLLTARRDQAAHATATEAYAVAAAQQFPYWLAWCEIVLAATHRANDPAGAADALGTAIAAYRETGARQLLPYALALRAECLLAAAAPRPALEALAEAATISDETGLRLYAAEVLRLTGLASRALRRGASDRYLRDAQAMAEGQGAWALALRALSDRMAGTPPSTLHQAARAMLQRVTADGDTPDTQALQRLLADAAPC